MTDAWRLGGVLDCFTIPISRKVGYAAFDEWGTLVYIIIIQILSFELSRGCAENCALVKIMNFVTCPMNASRSTVLILARAHIHPSTQISSLSNCTYY